MEKRLLGATALAGVALVLAGCGTDRGASQDPNALVTNLSILDYYNNEPDKTLVQTGLDSCATKLGVTISRETVPGTDLISKVLQQASSDDAPGRPDDRQPRGASRSPQPVRWLRWATTASPPTGSPRASSTPPRSTASSTGWPRWSTRSRCSTTPRYWPRPASPRRRPGRAAGRGQEADHPGPLRHRLQRQRQLRGRVAVPARHVDQWRRRDRTEQPAGRPRHCSCGPTW